MKKGKRILAAILIIAFATSLFTGCEKKKTTQGEVKEQPKQNVKKQIAATEYDLVLAGDSDYIILLSDTATEKEQFAATELQTFFQKATGKKLTIKVESSADLSGRILSVGDTKFSRDAGVVPTYDELRNGGCIIKTIDDDCFIKGYSDIGTRNGVYQWLYYCFDYECYERNEIVVTETKDLKLPAFEEVVMPSFDLREATNEPAQDKEYAWRMRFNYNGEIWATGFACHTSFQIVSPLEYDYTSEKYKDWFSEKQHRNIQLKQMLPCNLCYSNEEMRAEFIKNLKVLLVENEKTSKAPIIIIGQEDTPYWCTCEECVASNQKYGTDSATYIKFANYVQEEINQWYEKEYPGKEPVKLAIFGYYMTEVPPVDKNHKPIDDSVVFHEDLGIYYAPITASYAYPFTHEKNANVQSYIKGWAALTDNLYMWTYNLSCPNTLVTMNTFDLMQDNYKFMKENNCIIAFDQGHAADRYGSSGWTRLKTYLMSKLLWDVNLNMDELIDDFFANYFDVAGDTMRQIFNEERQWLNHMYADLGPTGNIFEELVKTEYWSYPIISDWMKQIDKAYKEIEVYQESDSERYQQLYDRITMESLQFRYLLIELYGAEYSESDLLNMKYAFKHDMDRFRMELYGEARPMVDIYKKWGIM